jgi:hypothetical protein
MKKTRSHAHTHSRIQLRPTKLGATLQGEDLSFARSTFAIIHDMTCFTHSLCPRFHRPSVPLRAASAPTLLLLALRRQPEAWLLQLAVLAHLVDDVHRPSVPLRAASAPATLALRREPEIWLLELAVLKLLLSFASVAGVLATRHFRFSLCLGASHRCTTPCTP